MHGATTNAVEPVNSAIQKVIRRRQSFPNEEAAMKLIFMGLKNIARKWSPKKPGSRQMRPSRSGVV
ncbi:MAG: transposase [Treponema sp.]|jgi:transposase-like protein|nr:transposase [Treponema sp.]